MMGWGTLQNPLSCTDSVTDINLLPDIIYIKEAHSLSTPLPFLAKLPSKCSPTFSVSFEIIKKTKTKLRGLSLRENYTDRATAACRRSDCQLVRIDGATWSAWRIPPAVFSRFSRQEPLLFYQVALQLYSGGWMDTVPDPLLFFFW
jgi:hypothetical protein